MNTQSMSGFGIGRQADLTSIPFASIEVWKKERDEIAKEVGQAGRRFNEFVRKTVRYFYCGGNHQVALVNSLLLIAHNSKMANKQRLAAYLMQCIPHKLNDRASKDKAPSFGAKLPDSQYDWPKVEQFLAVNLEWNKFGKEPDPRAYSLQLSAASAAKAALKNGVKLADLTGAIISAYADAAAEKAKKAAGKASR